MCIRDRNNIGATNQSQSSKSLSKINWDKDKFSTNWQEDLITGFDTKVVASISGVIDSIKETVKTMEISYKITVKLDDGRVFSESIYNISLNNIPLEILSNTLVMGCLLYTSDAADERSSVDLGGRRIIKKKKIT